VTITGTNFSPAAITAPPQNGTAQVLAVTTVTFGGVAATSVVVVSSTSITCTTPAGTGLVNVVVTNYIGASTGGTGVYTYNDAPTDIALSVSSIAENSASGSTVGTLSATDANTGDTAAFTLVTGTGSTDNASFTISGTSLKTAASFDFETKASYSIRVRVTDSGSLTFEKALTITVSNVNEAPTITSALTATPSSVKTGETVTFTVAASDPENATLTTSYNYGDGSTGTTATHAYTSSGTFTVVATVSDGTNSVTSSTTVTVASADLNNDGQNSPMDTDTDADGFPDAIEKLLGTSPTDATSTPSGGTAPTFGKFTVKAGTYYRSKTGKVTIQFQGILPAPAGLVLNGQKVVIDIGGNSQLFTLNSQGRSKVGATTFKITRTSPTEATFILHISGSLQENIVKNSPLDGNGRPTLLSLNIYFNNQLLNGIYTLQYKK
jgi:PKD repeat protein